MPADPLAGLSNEEVLQVCDPLYDVIRRFLSSSSGEEISPETGDPQSLLKEAFAGIKPFLHPEDKEEESEEEAEEDTDDTDDPHMCALWKRLEHLLFEPLITTAHYKQTRFGCEYSAYEASAKESVSHFEENKVNEFNNTCRNVLKDLADEHQRLAQKAATESPSLGKQFWLKMPPGMTMYQFDVKNCIPPAQRKKARDKKDSWKNFICVDFLAINMRFCQLYAMAMANARSKVPKPLAEWHRPVDRDLRHAYMWLGDMGPQWSIGNSPRDYRQGKSYTWWLDLDACTDIKVPCEIVNLAIQVLAQEGFPRTLHSLEGWTEEHVKDAMDCIGFFTSNSGTEPDRYEGEGKFSLHVHFMAKGPFLHEPGGQNDTKVCDPTKFVEVGHRLVHSLLQYAIQLPQDEEGHSGDSAESGTMRFGAILAAACVDCAVYRKLGAMKVKGCSKLNLDPEKPDRVQHLKPHPLSGKLVTQLSAIAFPPTKPDTKSEKMRKDMAGTALSMLTHPGLISPEWLQHGPPRLNDSPNCNFTDLKRKVTAVQSGKEAGSLSQIVEEALTKDLHHPKVHLTDQVQGTSVQDLLQKHLHTLDQSKPFTPNKRKQDPDTDNTSTNPRSKKKTTTTIKTKQDDDGMDYSWVPKLNVTHEEMRKFNAQRLDCPFWKSLMTARM